MPEQTDPQDHLILAHESLGEARHLLGAGYHRGAASASYYAMLHAARAVLALSDRRPRTHRGLIHDIRNALVEKGVLDEWYLLALEHEQKVRMRVDYEPGPAPTREVVESLLEDAERFVREMERLASASR